MWGIPWGLLLLPVCAWLLFRNKARRLSRDWGVSRQALLWFIFFLLLGAFISVNAATFYINLGGAVAFVFALYMLLRLSQRYILRALLAALCSGLFCFAFQGGWLWWLARLPFATDWLLPVFAAALAIALAQKPAASAAGLILGILGGNAVALLYLNQGGLAVEFGSLPCLNTLLLALFFCLWGSRLLQALVAKQPGRAAKTAI